MAGHDRKMSRRRRRRFRCSQGRWPDRLPAGLCDRRAGAADYRSCKGCRPDRFEHPSAPPAVDDEQVYIGLHTTIGRRRISQFIEDLVRPHVLGVDLVHGYQAMAADEEREAEALVWSDNLIGETLDAAR